MNREKLKVVFMGTPEFAVPCLKILQEHKQVEILSVITQPDRPKGRGQKMAFSPVKEAALSFNLPVYQPVRIKEKESFEYLKDLAPDWIVVVAFGQILPANILNLPKYGCCNVHASLLPKYRGAAPIHRVIINGEAESGVTTMFMDVGMDTGDMILKRKVKISSEMTTGELHDQLMQEGALCLQDTLEKLLKDEIQREKQQDAEATYAPMLTRDLEKIDWSRSAQQIHNLVRGLNPWPGAYTLCNGKPIKIWETSCHDFDKTGLIGQITSYTKEGFLVQTGQGVLEVLQVQPQNKKRMTATQYLCGHPLNPGEILQ